MAEGRNAVTNTDALSTALDSLFADPPAAEAGGRAYGAASAGIKGGSAWARLVKGALGGFGTLGQLTLHASNPVTLRVKPNYDDSRCRIVAYLGDVDASYLIDGYRISYDDVPQFWAEHPMFSALFSEAGLTLGDKTLRAQSPTDITLSLEGEQVVATFQPPLKAIATLLLGIKATRNVGRLNVTEQQIHVVVDDGPDAYVGLE